MSELPDRVDKEKCFLKSLKSPSMFLICDISAGYAPDMTTNPN
jgi:hypothetical protein